MKVRNSALAGVFFSPFAASGFGFHHRPQVVFDASGGLSPEKQFEAAAREFKIAADNVKKIAETTQTEIKNLGETTAETKKAADKALTEMNAVNTRLTDLEQKLSRSPGGSGNPEQKLSIGEQVIANEEVKAMNAHGIGWTGTVRVELKAITSFSATGGSGATGLVTPDRAAMVAQPNRPTVVRSLIMPGRTNQNSIDYPRETLVQLNAGVVAENPAVPKPQSDLKYELKNTPVRTIAHWIPASEQILADAPQLQSYIDGRLRYGLALAEDNELLLGDGSGAHLFGLMPQASVYVQPAGANVANQTSIDRLRLAMLQTVLALYPATGFVLNPVDWTNIVLTKDSQGRYIFTNPQTDGTNTLWGLPVAESMAMPVNNFLTGAMALAAQIFDREDANIKISTEDRDNFVKNMVTIRGEERLALVVYRPAALVKGTFS